LYLGNEEHLFNQNCSSTLRHFWGKNMETI